MARGGDGLLSPPLQRVIGLAPVSRWGPAGRTGGAGGEASGSQWLQRLRSSKWAFASGHRGEKRARYSQRERSQASL